MQTQNATAPAVRQGLKETSANPVRLDRPTIRFRTWHDPRLISRPTSRGIVADWRRSGDQDRVMRFA